MATSVTVHLPLRGRFHLKQAKLESFEEPGYFSYLEPEDKQLFLFNLKECRDLTELVVQHYGTVKAYVLKATLETWTLETKEEVFDELLPHLFLPGTRGVSGYVTFDDNGKPLIDSTNPQTYMVPKGMTDDEVKQHLEQVIGHSYFEMKEAG